MRALRRFVAAVLLALGALAAVACPAKEVLIEITDEGIGYVINACGIPCSQDCCEIDGGELPTESDQMQILLVLATADNKVNYKNARIRARSPCMQLRLGCDFSTEAGQSGRLADCLSVQLNDLIAEHMAEGLGFDGLDDPDDVIVVLAFFSVAGGAATPDGPQCTPSDLFACAGLTERYEDVYDITCASCTGGQRQDDPTSAENVAPCVGECFVEQCQQLLLLSES